MKIISRFLMLTLVASSLNACSVLPADEPAHTAHPLKITGATTSITAPADATYAKGATTTTSTITLTSKPMVRFQDTWSTNEVTVDLGTLDADTDFGYDGSGNGNGSITLTANALNYPRSGGAYPVLTSFKVINGGTTTEYVNLKAQCASQGMWVCAGGSCDPNPNCTVQSPTSFLNRDDWDQHQTPPYGYTSVNSFPHCDASVGTWTNCPAAQNKLPSGHYYAKYILMADSSLTVDSLRADLQVKITKKRDPISRSLGASNGVINLNVVLIGDKNINDSKTAKGMQNLNLLYTEVNRILKAGSSNISIGDIKTYNVSDANGGDYYAQLDYSLLGDLFVAGSAFFPAADEGNYINVFMVRDIEITGVNYSILGLAGAISGPPVNGTQSSGLAFSTDISNGPQGVLSEFNASCPSSGACSRNSQDANFLEMGATIAHELGHYLGLNHPSEKVSSNAQVVSIAHTLANNFTYTVTINGTAYSYTSDGSATDAEVAAGLNAVINADSGVAVVSAGNNNITLTAKMIGKTYSLSVGTNLYATVNSAGEDQRHDQLADTPTCAPRAGPYLDQRSCYLDTTIQIGGSSTCASACDTASGGSYYSGSTKTNFFCAATAECQFNHLMWYTTKLRRKVSGAWQEDGNQVSPQSSAIVQWNPFVK